MATGWVLGKISDALAPTVSSTVATAGSYAGGAVGAVGNTINGVADAIGGSIRRYGDGVKDYGNGIMDWSSADGVRAATASNPLGLSGGKASGKNQVTSGNIYRAPPSSASKTLMTTSKSVTPQKKITNGAPKKALPAPKPAGAVKKVNGAGSVPVKKPAAGPLKPVQYSAKTATPNPGAMKKKTTAPASKSTGITKSPTAVKKTAPVKAGAPVKKTNLPGPNPTGGANPLGLTW